MMEAVCGADVFVPPRIELRSTTSPRTAKAKSADDEYYVYPVRTVHRTSVCDVPEHAAAAAVCPECHEPTRLPAGAIETGRLSRCLACPSVDLFVRKDFPQRLGVGLVVLGVVASSISWGYGWPIVTFAILFATALLDVILYMIVPNALMCYRCGAQYRQVVGLNQHGAFDPGSPRTSPSRGPNIAGGQKLRLPDRETEPAACIAAGDSSRGFRSAAAHRPLASPRFRPNEHRSPVFRVPWIKNASESKTTCAGW